jgi:hypothetical protein
MTDKRLLAALKKHLRDTRGVYGAVTTACRVSESTVRRWVGENRLPENALVRQALEEFLTNKAVTK